MVNLKIAELRKKHNLTQQELGDYLSVSYQTISKWENGIVMPDITMLPKLSEYFQVSVDALLGLIPLDEEYRPSNSGTTEFWANRVDYVKRTRKTLWNTDYMKFLIEQVWHIQNPVKILDCGCGYGAMGLLLLPLLPKGSSYVGVDFSKEMLDEGKKIYEEEGIEAKFIQSDLLSFAEKSKYDIVFSQAVLRHVDDGERYLYKMVEFAKPGGLVISMECNREFEAAGLYVNGMDYAYLCEHEGLKKLWATELKMQNRDYSIAMKIPHYMKRMGLKNIDCRMNDRINFIEPEQEGYKQKLMDTIKSDHWDDEKSDAQIESDVRYFMNHGMNRKEAEDYCRQQNGIVHFLKSNMEEVSITKFNGIVISYGWK